MFVMLSLGIEHLTSKQNRTTINDQEVKWHLLTFWFCLITKQKCWSFDSDDDEDREKV